ncbi:MAG: AAA family ATPase [Byssovorax sp.]
MPQLHLEARRRDVTAAVLTHVEDQEPLLILKAPPGSGKTHVTTRAVVLAAHRRQRVAIATQTNAQADDFCRRMAKDFPGVPVVRFASGGKREIDLGASVRWARAGKEVPPGPVVVVATSAKWGASTIDEPYDLLFVDEAWQLAWGDFMTLSAVAPRFVLVGDPGQIPPVVTIDTARWQTSRRPPHLPAPEVILRDKMLPRRQLSLPVTTRLPHDSAAMVRAFYDFHFDSWAAPGERRLVIEGARPGEGAGPDAVIDLLTTGTVAMSTLPTPDAGPPLEEDVEVARHAAAIARRLLERGATVMTEDGPRPLTPDEIGLVASHRVMNTRMMEALGDLGRSIRVDTPERWQGLQKLVMIAVHPLSGVVHPSTFDLSTGRLCVMASRHQVGLILVSRDHVAETLRDYLPVADQAVGLPDEAGRGHAQNLSVFRQLEGAGRIARA